MAKINYVYLPNWKTFRCPLLFSSQAVFLCLVFSHEYDFKMSRRVKKKKKPWTSLLIFVSLYHYLLIYLSRRIHICVPNSILFVRIYCHFREWVSFWAWSNSMFVFHFLVMTGFRKSIIIAKWVTQHRVIFKMLSIHRLPKGIFQLSSVV